MPLLFLILRLQPGPPVISLFRKDPTGVLTPCPLLVSTCKILWGLGAVDGASPATRLPSSSWPFRGDFQKAGTTHRVAAHPPTTPVPRPLGLHRSCVPAGEGLLVPSTRLRHPLSASAIPPERSSCSVHNRDAGGHKKKCQWAKQDSILSCVYTPWRSACLCGQKHFLRTYYSSGKNDSWLLPNCGWKSLILCVEKDSLFQDCLLTPELSAWFIDQQSQHLQGTVRSS